MSQYIHFTDEQKQRAACVDLEVFLRSQGERAYTAFICRYYYADKIDTIAQILGVHKRTVMRELERMRQELRESLIREGYDYE